MMYHQIELCCDSPCHVMMSRDDVTKHTLPGWQEQTTELRNMVVLHARHARFSSGTSSNSRNSAWICWSDPAFLSSRSRSTITCNITWLPRHMTIKSRDFTGQPRHFSSPFLDGCTYAHNDTDSESVKHEKIHSHKGTSSH